MAKAAKKTKKVKEEVEQPILEVTDALGEIKLKQENIQNVNGVFNLMTIKLRYLLGRMIIPIQQKTQRLSLQLQM